jgi:hypothetical protein
VPLARHRERNLPHRTAPHRTAPQREREREMATAWRAASEGRVWLARRPSRPLLGTPPSLPSGPPSSLRRGLDRTTKHTCHDAAATAIYTTASVPSARTAGGRVTADPRATDGTTTASSRRTPRRGPPRRSP